MNTKNPENVWPATFPKPILFEVIGGPLDGILCCRVFSGMYIDGVKITHLINGEPLAGNMSLPGTLVLCFRGKCHKYYRFDTNGPEASRYLWEGLRV